MEKRYKIAIDVMGSDAGVAMMVRGAKMALEKREELDLLLVGDEVEIKAACGECGIDMSRVEILHASQVITNYDSPATALFQKTDSSLVRALSAAAEREDIVGLVNAGSTGALIAGTMRYLSRADRVRPALAATLPAENGNIVCLVDTGATIDCGATTLLHFAKLGTEIFISVSLADLFPFGNFCSYPMIKMCRIELEAVFFSQSAQKVQKSRGVSSARKRHEYRRACRHSRQLIGIY